MIEGNKSTTREGEEKMLRRFYELRDYSRINETDWSAVREHVWIVYANLRTISYGKSEYTAMVRIVGACGR